MDARLYDVIGYRDQTGWSSLSDFVLGPAESVASRMAIAEPDWSLYALDKAADCALFVELPLGTDLSACPFAYADQHRLARRVLTLPLAGLDDLASQIPAARQVILLFNIGRCGSTLVSAALNAVPGLWSLSEPDAYSTLVLQHYHSRTRQDFPPEQAVRLIRACTRLLFRPPVGRPFDVFAVKLRSQSLFQADLFHRALPGASFVFLYRDALSWAGSVYYMLRKYGFPERLTGDDRALAWSVFTAAADLAELRRYLDIDADSVPVEAALAPAWACNMVEYTRHLRGGVPFLALRYNEIKAEREKSVERLLRHCGLPLDHAAQALQAFDHDSQAGTKLSQDTGGDRLSVERIAALAEVLARQPVHADGELRLDDIYSGQTAG